MLSGAAIWLVGKGKVVSGGRKIKTVEVAARAFKGKGASNKLCHRTGPWGCCTHCPLGGFRCIIC